MKLLKLLQDSRGPFFKTLIPGLASFTILALDSFVLQNKESELENGTNGSIELVIQAIKNLGEVILGSYNNYFGFMLMMLLFNGLIVEGFDMIRSYHFSGKIKEDQKDLLLSWQGKRSHSEIVQQIMKTIITYSLLYCVYQAIWICALGIFPTSASLFQAQERLASTPLKFDPQSHIEEIFPNRILEEEEDFSRPTSSLKISTNVLPQKRSLSIGKVLSEIDINDFSMKLSKDGKTAFVSAHFPAALKIIDISDPEYPIILSSLPLAKGTYQLVHKTLIVSPDETRLYISNFEFLEIVDITDFKAPFLIAKHQDKSIVYLGSQKFGNEICKPNLLLSNDDRYLFVSGYGLQIFDILVDSVPVLLNSTMSRLDKSDNLIPSSIALSKDRKSLYYSNGDLVIYNIEEPENIKKRNSLMFVNPISSMIVSEDEKTAFVLGLNHESKIFLQKLHIDSDIHSINEGRMTIFDQVSPDMPIFLDQTPNNLFLLILVVDQETRSWHKLLIYDTQEQKLLTHDKMFIKNAFSVLFTEDYEMVFVGTQDKLKIVDLYLDFPNKNAFTESSNILRTFGAIDEALTFDFAHGKKDIIYSLAFHPSVRNRVFGIQRIVNGSDQQLANVSLIDIEGEANQMVISQDNNLAFLISYQKIFIVDISNPDKPKILKTYTEKEKSQDSINDLLLTRDGMRGFLTHMYEGNALLEVLDFTDPKNPIKRGSVSLKREEDLSSHAVLSKDEQIVFIKARGLSVYNVSNPGSPTLLATLPFLVDSHFFVSRTEMIISPDGKTLFIKDGSALKDFTVHIIDITNPASPQIKNELRFPSIRDDYSGRLLAISEDSKSFYVIRDSSLMVVDVSNVTTPRYLGAIQVSLENKIADFRLGNDGRKVYFLTTQGELHEVSLDPVYSTYLKEDVLLLGERYSMDLIALEMNKDMNYNMLSRDYRFTKFAMVESRSIQNANFEGISLKAAPSWMTVDQKSQILTIEARRKNDIGRYRLYFAFSTRLSEDVFLEAKVVSNMTEAEDLFATLLSLGFLDNEFYLTEYFGKYKEFILPSHYAPVKEQIYAILKKYYFETFNELQIVQSLNMSWTSSGKFQISTASMANLRVEFNLEGKAAKFLSREYGSLIPIVTNNKSRIDIEGSLKDINVALEEIVVNLPANKLSCDGEIIIDDKLNPIITKSIKNISRYFNHNQPPGLNKDSAFTIQNQIDKESVATGQYFQIKLDSHAFFDKYTEAENLKYQLVLVKDNSETAVLPTWLSFRDMTLIGTPPEEILDRDYEFKLIVKNEFQEFKEPFHMHVVISSSFVMKLLMKYSPYILTILGLYIKANLIYNIMAKKRYKSFKDFYVRAGEEITPEVIFPISFIEAERQEARNVLSLLIKKLALDKNQLLSHFMTDEGKLDKPRVSETIKRTLKEELSQKEKENFELYLGVTEGGLHPQKLINQIIINTLVADMLRLNEEKETKKYFEKIKDQWPRFVAWDSENSCFMINDMKGLGVGQKENPEESVDITENLLYKPNINVDLLKDAILGYAFDRQNVNALPVQLKFNVKERVKANFLKRFLKLDLQDSSFREKGKIGYGLEYFKVYHTLYLDGVVQRDLRGKTIVIQITNHQQRILKELWIIGKSENEDGDLNLSKEIEAKGKNYEIY